MKGIKKILSLAVAISVFAVSIAGCGSSQPSSTGNTSSTGADTSAGGSSSKPYIAVISKGFQHQFWQTVKKGAEDAAAKYNVDMTFDGPPSESDINVQVDMINSAIAKKPAALALAVLDTSSVTQQLNDCKSKNIPIIGFDSGIPDAPEGTLFATASTNNENAGALAAVSMFEDPTFQEALKAASTDKPVTIGVQSQDATSASIIGRTNGFINEMVKKCETLFAGQVAVTGHEKFKKAASSGKAAVNIFVTIPPSSNATDSQNASQSLLNTKGLIAAYASNEASVNGILAATTDGKDLDRANGKYKNITVVGFDAGKAQKAAVKNGWFLGSVTQDPYSIGYLAVELAAKAIKGEAVEDVDTGCKFYTAKNMEQSDIAMLLYD
ncbi:ribose transport system substrate-binding protein [Anaerobacterium chartisolvens]|uniref:Ribose transport system substrate-binding protein n=1 Tax=Anaerobacterium chartisolvens TaxID=1297424 RepID=A0A369B564_9FIRM|nr:substrate-binding domain-containing protein [Anaerobacterium chartisolvens]RCX14824.1 ribose transport system substrate-binding protein [Anaerobacterium chartisolvens]